MDHLNAGPAPQKPKIETVAISVVYDNMRFRRRHWLIVGSLFITLVLQSWEQLTPVYVSESLTMDLGMSPTDIGLLISTFATGMLVGVFFWGPIGDRIGRRAVSLWSVGSYSIITILSVLAPNAEFLVSTKFAAGLGYAGIFVVTFPMVLELVPSATRGRTAVYLSAGWPVGTLLAVGAAVFLPELGWRVMGMVGAAGLVSFLCVLRWVPESPYWLVRRDRAEDTHRVFGELGSTVPLTTRVIDTAAGSQASSSPMTLLKKPLLATTITMFLLNVTFSWGYWGLQVWLPTFLQERGFTLSSSLSFVALSALFQFPGYLAASWLTARYGRKRVLLGFIFGAVLSGVAFAFVETTAVLYIVNFSLAFFCLGAWGVWNTWNAELFPTSVRATGMSWGIGGQLIANAAAPVVIGALIERNFGFTLTMLILSAFMTSAMVLALFLRETEGKALS